MSKGTWHGGMIQPEQAFLSFFTLTQNKDITALPQKQFIITVLYATITLFIIKFTLNNYMPTTIEASSIIILTPIITITIQQYIQRCSNNIKLHAFQGLFLTIAELTVMIALAGAFM